MGNCRIDAPLLRISREVCMCIYISVDADRIGVVTSICLPKGDVARGFAGVLANSTSLCVHLTFCHDQQHDITQQHQRS
jgi:hypothetical protein